MIFLSQRFLENEFLIVEIEYPIKSRNVPRNKLSVNYSRSTDAQWDLTERFKVVEE